MVRHVITGEITVKYKMHDYKMHRVLYISVSVNFHCDGLKGIESLAKHQIYK